MSLVLPSVARVALAWIALVLALAVLPALGRGATIYVSGPSTNASPLRFKAIGAGEAHSLGVLSNGTVVIWGKYYDAQTNVPAGLSGVIAVAGGASHSVALKSDGTVVAWGENRNGQTNVPPGLSEVVA